MLLLPAVDELATRVANQHLEIQQPGHFRHIARQLPRADQQQAPARAMDHPQGLSIERQHVSFTGRLQKYFAGGQVQFTRNDFMGLATGEQLLDPIPIVDTLLGQAQGATAGQAETCGFLAGHAVGDQLHRRPVKCEASVVQPGNQVIFDTPARDRTNHHAVFAQGQHGAGCPGRSAPGFDHAVQHHPLTGAMPLQHAAQDVQIGAVHQAPAFCQPDS
ncbi:hypothetical protein D3C75_890380 [compost metagenome]